MTENFNFDKFDTIVIPIINNEPICDKNLKPFINKFNQTNIFDNNDSHYFSFLYNQRVYSVILLYFENVNVTSIKKLYKKSIKEAIKINCKHLFIFLPNYQNELAVSVCIDSLYVFDKYMSKKSNRPNIYFNDETIDREKISTISYYKSFCKDLVNEPANILTPEKFCNIVKRECEKIENLNVTIYDKQEIKKLSMSAFLEVSKGSNNPPYLIKIEYCTDKSLKKTAIVGKGITFDSGGYSLKSSASMTNMKSDMAGGASAVCAVMAIAKSKIRANVVCVVAVCENIISSKAYKLGDVISSLSKKTIEIDNTDAEGRLTLADAVTYCDINENADEIITIATLTGSAIKCLSNYYTPVITNNDDMYNDMKRASKNAFENIWQFPFDEIYTEGFKSNIADLKNTAGPDAGCISAGMFIEKFCNKNFLHLDIAGSSWFDKPNYEFDYGATGFGVRLLFEYIKQIGEKND